LEVKAASASTRRGGTVAPGPLTTSTSASTPGRFLQDLRATLIRRRNELLEGIPAEGRAGPLEGAGMALGRENARILDDLLASLFGGLSSGALASEASRNVAPGAWSTVALAGVGSYGRGAVALKSDLDVRLCARNVGKAAALADALLYPLWDM